MYVFKWISCCSNISRGRHLKAAVITVDDDLSGVIGGVALVALMLADKLSKYFLEILMFDVSAMVLNVCALPSLLLAVGAFVTADATSDVWLVVAEATLRTTSRTMKSYFGTCSDSLIKGLVEVSVADAVSLFSLAACTILAIRKS